jgi:GNAT superfamily N-acetyltransferase
LFDAVKDKIKLFSLCFGDDEESVSEFFSIDDVVTLTEKIGEDISAMASLVPLNNEGGLSGLYAFGVCVHPLYRGKGEFRRIMADCEAYAKDAGADFICLIPADERLACTYMRMGYTERIGLYHNSPEGYERIFSLSQRFLEYAKPEGDEKGPVEFGLMKPLTEFKKHNMAFFSPMGDC